MTHSEADARHAEVMAEAIACPGAGPAGDTRPPQFGEWMRGIWAGEKNPQRDGRYVRTVRRSGRFNPGTFYELTDGRGAFWQYPASSTVFIQAPAGTDGKTPDQLRQDLRSGQWDWGEVAEKPGSAAGKDLPDGAKHG